MKIAICSVIKNESKYLEEWIRHHLNLGFNLIFLYEDWGSESHKEITDKYPQVILNSLQNINLDVAEEAAKCSRQLVLHKQFIKENKGKLDWILFIDCDEYLHFTDGYDLESLLEEFSPYPGIIIHWKMIGADGQVFYENKDLQERFHDEKPIPITNVKVSTKCFINLNKFKGFVINHHRFSGHLVNTLHLHTYRCLGLYKKCYIAHYFTKSWEEWCNRWKTRGEINWGWRKLDDFFDVNIDMKERREELHEIAKSWLGDELYNLAIIDKTKKKLFK